MPRPPLPTFLALLQRSATWVRGALGSPDERRGPVILLLAPILLTVWVYQGKADSLARLLPGFHGPWPGDVYATLYEFLTAFMLMFLASALVARYVLRIDLSELGLQPGDTPRGLSLTGLLLPVALLTAYLASRNPAIRAAYPLAKGALPHLELFLLVEACYLLFYLGWEFFFRGLMLLGLEEPYGPLAAILIQTIPSTLVHIGRPFSENLAAIGAGIVLGYVAVRTRSIYYPMLLHAIVGIGTDLFIALL